MIPDITLFGQPLGHQLPLPVLAFGWGVYLFGAVVASVSTLYSGFVSIKSGEVDGFINLVRNIWRFSVGYFQLPFEPQPAASETQVSIINFSACYFVFSNFWAKVKKMGWGCGSLRDDVVSRKMSLAQDPENVRAPKAQGHNPLFCSYISTC